MKDLIKMGKKSLVRYNVFEGEQKRTYWFEDQKGKTVVDLEKIGFEKGRRYFKGKTKVAGNQSEFLYEAELKMI